MLIITILFNIAIDNPELGAIIWLTCVVLFMTYTNSSVMDKDLEEKIDMMNSPIGRNKYFKMINT
jgi:hypothetical protein